METILRVDIRPGMPHMPQWIESILKDPLTETYESFAEVHLLMDRFRIAEVQLRHGPEVYGPDNSFIFIGFRLALYKIPPDTFAPKYF